MAMLSKKDIAKKVHELVLANVPEEPDESDPPSRPPWSLVRQTGTELWLDTGDIDAISELWCREFSALTTNNTLLNKEVQKGIYDDLIETVADELRDVVDEDTLILEIAFVLNAVHGLRLHRRFGANVSVELHTDLSHDAAGSVAYGRRYNALCPDGFYVKVGLTPAGLVAARRLGESGVPVNFTLGFSARQNVLITHVARPTFCNVFLGRLGSVVEDNGLGSGKRVGIKATLSSQWHVKAVNGQIGTSTRQIAASMRNAEQVAGLLGVDVHTMPPDCARAYMESDPREVSITPQTGNDPDPGVKEHVDLQAFGLTTLWAVPEDLHEICHKLGNEAVAEMSGDDLIAFLADRGYADLLPDWSEDDERTAADDGKIPVLDHWQDRLDDGEIGLDALMNLSGLMSFTADQKAMDDRIRSKIG